MYYFILLQNKTKFQKSIKVVLNCCKLQVVFKGQNKLCNNFCFKDPLQCGWCNECYYGECVRHFVERSGEHIDILPLTKKRGQHRKVVLFTIICSIENSPTFQDFSVVCHENKKYLLELN